MYVLLHRTKGGKFKACEKLFPAKAAAEQHAKEHRFYRWLVRYVDTVEVN